MVKKCIEMSGLDGPQDIFLSVKTQQTPRGK